jgi:hypothetical protein
VVIPDAGMPPNDVDGGSAGSADTGANSGPTPDAGFQEAPRPGEPPVSEDGCGCQNVGKTTGKNMLLWPLALMFGLLWQRKRFVG